MVVQEYAANIPAAILVRVREELELGARKTLDDCLLLNRKRCLTAGQNAVCECKQTLGMHDASKHFFSARAHWLECALMCVSSAVV